jgi:aerobic carbon-monoxide dehydrogenase medium subunit
MKPARFTYAAPTTLDGCVELLARHGDDAKLLAGGQSLVPLMNLRLAAPEVVVDLNRVEGLSYVRERDGHVAVGALTRHRELAEAPLVRSACPLLAFAASLVGYPAIRARGTLGGSLAHADPSAELPLAAVALDAELEVAGPGGRRAIAARDFFAGYFTTAMAPEEVLVEVRFARQAPGGWAFEEFSRKTGDFALAAVAVTATFAGGALEELRIAVGGAGDRPLRAPGAEATLRGATPSAEALAQAADAVAQETVPQLDGAVRDERRHLVRVLAERALTTATAAREAA